MLHASSARARLAANSGTRAAMWYASDVTMRLGSRQSLLSCTTKWCAMTSPARTHTPGATPDGDVADADVAGGSAAASLPRMPWRQR
jgi:hypothetical protein